MSTVMRPRGPLPPQVYWTRRLLLVAIVVVVGALVWWVMPGANGSGNASADPGTTGTADTPSQQQPALHPGTPSTTTPIGRGTPRAQHPSAGGPTGTGTTSPTTPTETTPSHSTPSRHPLAPPNTICDPAKVALTVVVDSAPQGHGTSLGLRMGTTDGSICTLGITPKLLEIRITSGIATIWQSRSCPDAVPAKNVVVRPKPAVLYSLQWDGQINPDSCSATNEIAMPGGYWAEAALIGGVPHKSYFEVTSPGTPVHPS